MANLPITQLPQAIIPQGDETLVLVQNGITSQIQINKLFNNNLIPTELTVSANVTVDLSDALFQTAVLIKISYNSTGGGQQNMTLNLPDATLINNLHRTIRIITNGGFSTNTRVNLTPINGQTLDGQTLPYVINKSYEAIQIWSDGDEWFIIQKKG